MNRGVAAAGGVLVLGGLFVGALPGPLADFGCQSAFASQAPLEQSIEVVVACEEVRADRQNLALGMMVLGLAAVTGASLGQRALRPQRAMRASDDPVR
jgi:hypothetical protein